MWRLEERRDTGGWNPLATFLLWGSYAALVAFVSWGIREAWREAGGEANRQVVAHTSSVSVDERDGDVVSAKYKYGTL
jgi:hypothetical protein